MGEDYKVTDQEPEPGAYQAAEPVRSAPSVTLETAETLGDAFKAARRASGRSLAELSSTTKVPVRYLEALEDGRRADLPSRPFALGHARSYAQALGLDETAVAERLRREYDLPNQKLQAPVGLAFDDNRRKSPVWAVTGVVLVLAVVGWNVLQRVNLIDAAQSADLSSIPESWRVGSTFGEIELEAPRPAPPDQTTPVLYVTPGLEEVLAPALAGAQAAAAAPDMGGPVGAAFNPRGAVYGTAAGNSGVILQARRASTIVVRAADGVVHFARQLAAGEAYRAPQTGGLVVDVSDPTAFDLFLNGERAGRLEQPQTSLSQLNARAEALGRQAAAEAEARNREAQRAAEARLREAEAAAAARVNQAQATPDASVEIAPTSTAAVEAAAQ
ncbi:MAG: helix-turn-helix domain-containing protein [Caulobacterales bacterium]|nr:helix-turn-helix domain-containing protein [Caulobacterales bacterium]